MSRSTFGHRRGSLLSRDTFTRADSTTNLGSTDGDGLLDPVAWTQNRGTWGISSNEAYTSAATTRSIATVDLGTPDADIQIHNTTANQFPGAIFRFVDTANYWRWCRFGVSNAELTVRELGVDHQITAVSAGTGIHYRVITAGDVIRCYANDSFLAGTTDTRFNTATKFGMYDDNSTTTRLDSWEAHQY